MSFTIHYVLAICNRTGYAETAMSGLGTGSFNLPDFGLLNSPIRFNPFFVASIQDKISSRATTHTTYDVFHLTLAKHIVCLSQRNFT